MIKDMVNTGNLKKDSWQEFLEEDKTIRSFFHKNKSNYIYGSGKYGTSMKKHIDEYGIKAEGVIVSKKEKIDTQSDILEIDTILGNLDASCGIVLALKEEYQKEVLNKYKNILEKKGVCLFVPSERYLSFIYRIYNDWSSLRNRISGWREEFITKAEYNKNEWKKILLIQVEDAIGDTIWSSAFLREFRRNFPSQHITYLVSEKMKTMICNCPYVDEILYYPYKDENSYYTIELENYASDYAKRNLKDKGYDVVFLIKALPHYAYDALDNVMLALYSGVETRIAHAYYVTLQEKFFYSVWESLFSRIIINMDAEHDVSRDLSLLQACDGIVEDQRMEMWVDQQNQKEASEYFSNIADDSWVIALGLMGREPRRNWPVENYVTLMKNLNTKYKDKVCFALFGGKNVVEIQEKLVTAGVPVIDMINKTSLSVSAAAMQKCDFYLGSDTSLMHMAASFGLPVIELTANLSDGKPTDQGAPERTGPWMVKNEVIRPKKALDGCTGLCLKPYTHCITQIDVETVEAAVERMISEIDVAKEHKSKNIIRDKN